MMNDWNSQKEISYTKQYKCPYCENVVASLQHFSTKSDSYNYNDKAEIWICPHCKNATIFVSECVGTGNLRKYLPEKMIPNNKIGKDDIKNLPDDIKFLWEEIRNSYQANAFDGVSMLTRTLLLMICENLDKSKTINKDSSYKQCVDYLIDNGLIAKQSEKYADKLRKTANEFTHELQKVPEEKAKELIHIVEFLLVTIYQYGEQKINK